VDFAAAVGSLGHEFRILTTTTAPSAGSLDRPPLFGLWRTLDAAGAPWLRTRSLLSPAAALAHHLKTEGTACDLLHAEVAYPFGVAAVLGAALARWKGPIAITPMGEDTLVIREAGYGFRRYLLPRRAVAWALSRASAIRCISPLHERIIAEVAPDTPRRVIPLNVSSAIVAASEEDADVRSARRREARRAVEAELAVAGRPIILSLGRLHPFKGIDVLIGALRRVPDAVLLVAGPSLVIRPTGDEQSRLAQVVERWGIGERVRFLGAVSGARAMQLLAAADVVAVPSRLESLNKVCVEATAVGTSFVVTETTGISAWTRAANIGVIVPPDYEEALAHGLRAAVERRAPLAPGRIAAFVQQFSPRTVAEAVIDFYRDVTGVV
jgi:glycosyltransferase involved in cell wall biosynthesis